MGNRGERESGIQEKFTNESDGNFHSIVGPPKNIFDSCSFFQQSMETSEKSQRYANQNKESSLMQLNECDGIPNYQIVKAQERSQSPQFVPAESKIGKQSKETSFVYTSDPTSHKEDDNDTDFQMYFNDKTDNERNFQSSSSLKDQSLQPNDNCNSSNFNNKNNGAWTQDEHKKFVKALKLYGKDWIQISNYIGTRTSSQARSHAQKFFCKLQNKKKFKELLIFDKFLVKKKKKSNKSKKGGVQPEVILELDEEGQESEVAYGLEEDELEKIEQEAKKLSEQFVDKRISRGGIWTKSKGIKADRTKVQFKNYGTQISDQIVPKQTNSIQQVLFRIEKVQKPQDPQGGSYNQLLQQNQNNTSQIIQGIESAPILSVSPLTQIKEDYFKVPNMVPQNFFETKERLMSGSLSNVREMNTFSSDQNNNPGSIFKVERSQSIDHTNEKMFNARNITYEQGNISFISNKINKEHGRLLIPSSQNQDSSLSKLNDSKSINVEIMKGGTPSQAPGFEVPVSRESFQSSFMIREELKDEVYELQHRINNQLNLQQSHPNQFAMKQHRRDVHFQGGQNFPIQHVPLEPVEIQFKTQQTEYSNLGFDHIMRHQQDIQSQLQNLKKDGNFLVPKYPHGSQYRLSGSGESNSNNQHLINLSGGQMSNVSATYFIRGQQSSGQKSGGGNSGQSNHSQAQQIVMSHGNGSDEQRNQRNPICHSDATMKNSFINRLSNLTDSHGYNNSFISNNRPAGFSNIQNYFEDESRMTDKKQNVRYLPNNNGFVEPSGVNRGLQPVQMFIQVPPTAKCNVSFNQLYPKSSSTSSNYSYRSSDGKVFRIFSNNQAVPNQSEQSNNQNRRIQPFENQQQQQTFYRDQTQINHNFFQNTLSHHSMPDTTVQTQNVQYQHYQNTPNSGIMHTSSSLRSPIPTYPRLLPTLQDDDASVHYLMETQPANNQFIHQPSSVAINQSIQSGGKESQQSQRSNESKGSSLFINIFKWKNKSNQ